MMLLQVQETLLQELVETFFNNKLCIFLFVCGYSSILSDFVFIQSFFTDRVQPGCYINSFVFHSFIQYVMTCHNNLTHPIRKSQGAEILRERSSPTTCHMAHVICHMSHDTCHMSLVTCPMSFLNLPFFDKVLELIGGGSVINGAYLVQFQQNQAILFIKHYQYLFKTNFSPP